MRAFSPVRGQVALAALMVASWGTFAGVDNQIVAEEATIVVEAGKPTHRITRTMTGACLEDVNHEVYGGLYSQMIFGESFQEPPAPVPLKGFTSYEGSWRAAGGVLDAGAGAGPKLVSDTPAFASGEVGVDVFFSDNAGGNAGLLVKVAEPGNGADQFIGYEVSLTPEGTLVLHRHRNNWEPLRTVACQVPIGKWIPLAVKLGATTLEISVADKTLLKYEDREYPLHTGRVGLRTWQRTAKFRNFWVTTAGTRRTLPFEAVEPLRTLAP